jgi:hypothetical protein
MEEYEVKWAKILRRRFDEHEIPTKSELIRLVLTTGEENVKNGGNSQYWVTHGINALLDLTDIRDIGHMISNKEIRLKTGFEGKPRSPGMWAWDKRGCEVVENINGYRYFRIKPDFYNAIKTTLATWPLP